MARGKKKRRAREEPVPKTTGLLDRPAPPRPAVLRSGPTYAEKQRILEANASAADVMLVECSTFGVTIRDGDIFADPYRPEPGVCKTCGLTPDHVGFAGCPRMRSVDDAVGLMLPAHLLHADV